jgi:photosystem II stability/assembly factor-like uncharacterized protein
MKKLPFAPLVIGLVSMGTLFGLLFWAGSDRAGALDQGPMLSPDQMQTVIAVQPDAAPNDLDTAIVITGTNFEAGANVQLDDTSLAGVTWIGGTRLEATVPWGLDPGVYTATVVNPGGAPSSLPNAFTVTQGIGVWTTNGPYGGGVGQLVLHPVTPTTVYALGSDVGLFVSDDAATHWEMAFLLPRVYADIAFDAQNADVMYVGDGHTLNRTMDGAQTWEGISIRPGGWWEHVPAAHPTLPGVVFAAVGSWRYPEQVGGVFRSDDYGTSWITLTVGLTDTHFTSLAVHPILTQTMLAGTESGNLFYSLDGGQTWIWTTQLTDTVANLYFNPFEPLQAWATTSGESDVLPSLYRSQDLVHWAPITVDDNLAGRYSWDMDFTSGTIWATTDGTYFSTDDGDTWTRLDSEGPCGPGAWLAINPQNPQEMYDAPFIQGVCKSEDGGLTWRQVNDGLAAIIPAETAVDPNGPDTIYVRAPGLDLAKSESGGQAWRVLNIGIGGSPRVGLAVDSFLPNHVYANTMRSEDGGDTWQAMTFTLPITWNGWGIGGVSSIVPHPAIPGRILSGLSVSNGTSDNGLLYASNDHGEHWSYIGPAQPIGAISQIAYDSENPDLIYVATWASGLWKSADSGQSWMNIIPLEGFTEAWQVFTHPVLTDNVYAFVRQPPHGEFKLLISYDAGETWATLPGGPGGPFYFAPTQPPSLYSACFLNDLMYLCRSWDGGYTWEVVNEMQQEITTLAGGTDGERTIIYVGTKGGQVSSIQSTLTLHAQPFAVMPGRGSLLGAGVYRLTLLPPKRVYLPLVVVKAHTP